MEKPAKKRGRPEVEASDKNTSVTVSLAPAAFKDLEERRKAAGKSRGRYITDELKLGEKPIEPKKPKRKPKPS